jgi:hypothetical protein
METDIIICEDYEIAKQEIYEMMFSVSHSLEMENNTIEYTESE